VQILKAGVPQRVGIETGVANETSTEVLKGLEEGQEVVVGRPRTNIFGGGF
jgi:macrolide-specific efflux system membrane fusion protein